MAASIAARDLFTPQNKGPMFLSSGSSPTPDSTHYRLMSSSYGGFAYDSVGRAAPPGASTKDLPTTALNGPPSAVYLPESMGRTNGTAGITSSKTVAFTPDSSFAQKRTADQVVKWTAAV